MTSASQRPLSPCDFKSRGWNLRDAAHLVRRTRFGASYSDVQQAFDDGPGATIERLLTEQAESSDFLARDSALHRVAMDSADIIDLRAWWVNRMLYSANPLVEKLSLFWHGHFATSNAKVRSVRQMEAQNALFRRRALGTFRELLHDVASDVAMLVWLDGNANRRRQPNENFARELFELFALGVGNYSERDIKEAARAFSGWHVRKGEFWYNSIQHDISSKTVFDETGRFDGDDVVELCLKQDAAPRFLARKLLQFFVTPSPPEDAVAGLAACIRENEFSMRPVLRTLFSSTVFFAPESRHSIIKSPADFVVGTQRTLEARVNLRESVAVMTQLGQSLFEPPTVEGWKGGRTWINSATMLGRANFAAELAVGNRFGQISDPADVAARLGWHNSHDVVDYYTELLLSRDVPSAQSAIEEYLAQATGALGWRLRGVVHLLLTLPEFNLV
jgi:uncharacterized protein (DUF1800 family)